MRNLLVLSAPSLASFNDSVKALLQQQWEISRRYAMFATPIAYSIDEDGIIRHDVAVGVEAIQALIVEARHQADWTQQPLR